MKLTRRTNARFLIGSLRRRIRTREGQVAKLRRENAALRSALADAREGWRTAFQRADYLSRQVVTARDTLSKLDRRLKSTGRRSQLVAPPVEVAPKPAPRKGSLPAAFDRLEVD